MTGGARRAKEEGIAPRSNVGKEASSFVRHRRKKARERTFGSDSATFARPFGHDVVLVPAQEAGVRPSSRSTTRARLFRTASASLRRERNSEKEPFSSARIRRSRTCPCVECALKKGTKLQKS